MQSRTLIRVVLLNLFAGLVLWTMPSCKHVIPHQNNNSTLPPVTTTQCSPDTAYFQQQVLPIITSNCAMSGCHDAASHKGDIVLLSYGTIKSGSNIIAFNAGSSKLWKKIVEPNANDRMPPPPYSALSQEQKNVIYRWIMQGAFNNSCQSTNCDTSQVSYTGQIRPLINNKCLGCHNSTAPSGNVDLSSYAGVKLKVTDGKLWGSINFLSGFSPMPKNGSQLSNCELAFFRIWIAAGAPQ